MLGRLGKLRPQDEATQEGDVELGTVSSTRPMDEDKLKMQEFFMRVAELRKAMELIRKKTDDIERMHKQALNSIQADEQAECAKKIEMIIDRTNLVSNKIRTSLKEMNKTNNHLQAAHGASDPNLRIRVTQHSQLTKAFIDTMNNYQAVQERYKLKYHQQLQRQYLIVNPGATQEELAKLVENEGGSMVSQQIFSLGDQKADAKRALEEMRERHQDIMMIEKSILELNQLFVEMATLVEQQGDLVNQIESHVDKAAQYTEQAASEMKVALQHQKSRLKKKWLLFFLILLILAGVAAAIYFLAIKPSHHS